MPASSYGRITIKTGGTIYYSGNLTTARETWEDKSYEWSTNPKTGLAWTWSDIDDLQIGIECSYILTYCTQLYVVVDYEAKSISKVRIYIKTITGILTFTGAITQKDINKILAGELNMTGTLNKVISRLLTGVLTFGAVIGKLTKITLSAALTFKGAAATFLIKIFPRHLKRIILLIRDKK